MSGEQDRHDRIRAIFAEVVALDAGERVRHLEQACGEDSALRLEVEALIDAFAARDSEMHHILRDLAADDIQQAPSHAPDSSRRPDPHELLGSRIAQYEIREWCGGGGMGVVYKAFDTRLGRNVALKFLPREMTHDPLAKDRLIDEARASSRLDHDNICTVHEIGETDQGQVFLAMTFYDGETLKKKLAAGPLPFDDAIQCSVQVARGLSRAHAEGIIHRDVKPANLMVTRDGTVKILDFGIAQTAELVTRRSQGLGTPGYTSPEQLRGETLDQRADIWSLGVVMYELFTGQRPFEGAGDKMVSHRVLHDDPEPPASLNPAVPPRLQQIVLTCLEREKGRRYAHVDDLLKDLQALEGASRSRRFHARSGQDGERITTPTFLRGRPKGTAVGLALAVLVAVLLTTTEAGRSALPWLHPPAPARTHLAVLPLTVSDSLDEELSTLASGLVRILSNMSATLQDEANSLWVVPATEVERAQVRTSAEAMRVFNVDVVLTGGLRRAALSSELTLELVDPRGPRVIAARTLQGPPHPDFDADATDALRGLLGLPRSPSVAGQQIAARTSPGAPEFYVQGLGYLRRYDIAGNLEHAITLFQRAVADDSTYAAAHAGICEATWEQYRATRVARLAADGLAACDRARTMAEGQPTVLVTLGRLYVDRGEYRRAEATLRRALELSPSDPDALRWLGRAYEQQGRMEAAERAHRQAIAQRPTAWIYYLELGQLLAYSSRHDEAAEQFESVVQLTPDNHIGYLGLGYSRMRQGRVAEAKSLFEAALNRQPSSTAYHNLGYLLYRESQFEDAIEALERGLDLDEANLSIWRWLGHAQYWNGRRSDADAAWGRVIDLAEGHFEINPREGLTLMALAESHVLLGQPDQGRAYLDLLVSLEQLPTFQEYEVARLYEILGNRATALAYLERALARGFDRVFVERDPWLEELRADPRFGVLFQTIERAA